MLMEHSQNVPIFGPQGEILLVRYSPDQPHKFGTTQVDIPYGPAAHGELGDVRYSPDQPRDSDGKAVPANIRLACDSSSASMNDDPYRAVILE